MKKIATIAVKGENGGEFNLVSWNGKPLKIDVSPWNEKEGGGFTFSSEEGLKLTKSLAEYLASDSSSIFNNDSIKNADSKNEMNMLLTENQTKQIENRLKADTDKERKENILLKYAMYQIYANGIKTTIPELKEYGKMITE
jgi:hypothetical protein